MVTNKALYAEVKSSRHIRESGFAVFVLFIGIFIIGCEQINPEDRRQALHLPSSGFKGDPEKGLVIYRNTCVNCHGSNGRGTSEGPPLVHRVYRTSHHADYSFHLAVRDGVKSHHWNFGDMNPVPTITPDETEHVVAYIRREQRRRGIN